MNNGLKSLLLLVCVASLTGCQSAGNLLNGSYGVPGRLLEAVGRTVGMVAQNDTPEATDTKAVMERGQMIQQRADKHSPVVGNAGTAVVQR